MKISNFPPNTRVMVKGIKRAIPNMLYGNTLFILSIIIRPLMFNRNIENVDLKNSLFLAIIFFMGILVAISPTIVGGALLALGLNKDKNAISTKASIVRGALIGFVGMAIVCALIYPIDQPHGLPDPSFPLNASTAIIISTLAGSITGMQLTKDILKSN